MLDKLSADRQPVDLAVMCTCVLSRFSHVRLFATLRLVARQVPLSMGSPGKNTGVGYHVLPPGESFRSRNLSDPPPAVQEASSPLNHWGSPVICHETSLNVSLLILVLR